MLMTARMLMVFIAAALMAARALAQDDVPTIGDIAYDQVVEETITRAAFFDWWRVQALEGDILVIEMAASGGLEPIVALLAPSGDAVTRSENGAPDSIVQIEYTAPAAGLYTIVATRVGSAEGASTGPYVLRLRRANAPVSRPNPYQDVTFRCADFEAVTALTLSFGEDARRDLMHRITVYGLDGFKPVVRLNFSATPEYDDCNTDAKRTIGDTFTLPGEAPYTVSADSLDSVSQLIMTGAENMETITLTVASREGAPGRYVALVEGFTIERGGDRDAVEVRIGPLAAQNTALTVYMVAAPDSRLDPLMTLPDAGITCDDAGRRGCEQVPSLAGARFTLNEFERITLTADRSDAGLVLTPGSPDPVLIELSSRGGDTFGAYYLVLLGELPPRE